MFNDIDTKEEGDMLFAAQGQYPPCYVSKWATHQSFIGAEARFWQMQIIVKKLCK